MIREEKKRGKDRKTEGKKMRCRDEIQVQRKSCAKKEKRKKKKTGKQKERR